MSLKVLTVITAVLMGFATPSGAATTFYTDRAAFEAATSSLTTESFADGTLEAGVSVTSTAGSVISGIWFDRPTPAPTSDSTTWTFGPGITAFGADYDLTPGGAGNGLRFTVDGVELATQLQIYTPTFFGFITDAAFSTVLVSAGDDNSPFAIAETHLMDNLSFGMSLAAAPAAVPLPAGLPMLLAALGGLGWMRRRRKAI